MANVPSQLVPIDGRAHSDIRFESLHIAQDGVATVSFEIRDQEGNQVLNFHIRVEKPEADVVSVIANAHRQMIENVRQWLQRLKQSQQNFEKRRLRTAQRLGSSMTSRYSSVSRYHPIRDRLRSSAADTVSFSFEEIADLVGGLPDSAMRHAWWWGKEDPSTTTHSQCKSWQAAGYEAEVDIDHRQVTFRRKSSSQVSILLPAAPTQAVAPDLPEK